MPDHDRRKEYENESHEILRRILNDLERSGHALRGIKERLHLALGLVGFLWLVLRLDLRNLLRLIYLRCLLLGLPKSKERIS